MRRASSTILLALALGALAPGCVTRLTWERMVPPEPAAAPAPAPLPYPVALQRAVRSSNGVYHLEVTCSDQAVRHVTFDPSAAIDRVERSAWPSASDGLWGSGRIPVAVHRPSWPFPRGGVPLIVDDGGEAELAPALSLRGSVVWLREAPGGDAVPLVALVRSGPVRRSDPYGGRTRSMRKLVALCLLPFTVAIDGALLPIYLIALPAEL